MTLPADIQSRAEKLISAFDKDGYAVNINSDVVYSEQFLGMRAFHKTAFIGKTGLRKKTFYLEGDPHTMGYFLGKLAENDVEQMCTTFNENVIFEFINLQIEDEELKKILAGIINEIIYLLSQSIYKDIPQNYIEEMNGILDGCKSVNSKTKVTSHSLLILNVGIDALLAYIYTGILPVKKRFALELKPEHFNIPIMCNAFSQYGKEPDSGKKYHYMGRDFMFPTAGVFQNLAAMIIRKPLQGNMTISVAAPGMIGAIAGLNKTGVGVGVDMSPASNCNTERPGINSLLLTRIGIENGINLNDAAAAMIKTQRGVTWDYPLADGSTDDACILETGATTKNLNFIKTTDKWVVDTIKKAYPKFKDLLKNPSAPLIMGAMERNNKYKYPPVYQTFNEPLIDEYRKRNPEYKYVYNTADFGDEGYINKTWTDKNCPGPYYFAPMRSIIPNGVMVTNHFVIPEMRLCAMNYWTAIIAGSNLNDIQWRYDELHNKIITSLKKGFMTYNEALAIIDFLAPNRNFPDYYNPIKEGVRKPWQEVIVHGAVSIMDLKAISIESHYGYYGDEWIQLNLINYDV